MKICRQSTLCGFSLKEKAGATIGRPYKNESKICNLRGFELQLELVSNQGNKFGIRWLALCVTDSITEKSLECVQIAPVPGNFDGVSDCPLHSGRRGLECFRHLGVQDLCDGIGVPYGPPGSLAGCSRRTLQRLSANVDDLLLTLSSRNSLLYGFENMIAKQKWKVKLETNEHFRKLLSVFFVL